MKNKITILLGLLLCAISAPAEVVESVSFNPSRLGQFERLKISDQLSAPGGVQSSQVTVRSAGRVTVQNAGNYQLDYALPGGSVEMPATLFETTDLQAQGGKGEFTCKGDDCTSVIKSLQGDGVRLKANLLQIINQIKVLGTPAQAYDGTPIRGLVLGGNDIPNPNTGCSLQWVERRADDGNTYQVLACSGTNSCSKTCSAGYTLNKGSCTCECTQICTEGSELNKTTCQCEENNGKWCLTPAGTFKAGLYTNGVWSQCASANQSDTYFIDNAPVIEHIVTIHDVCYSTKRANTEFYTGPDGGCIPGGECEKCGEKNLPEYWVLGFKSISSDPSGSTWYYCYYSWQEATCQYIKEGKCADLSSGTTSVEKATFSAN